MEVKSFLFCTLIGSVVKVGMCVTSSEMKTEEK